MAFRVKKFMALRIRFSLLLVVGAIAMRRLG
jgi:hypothetical protein